jgi:hypothetical protein
MPQLRILSIVIGFLKISDNVEYLKYKKDHTLDDSKIPLNKLKTAKGRLRLAIEPKMNKLYNQFRQTFLVSEQKLNK